MAMRKTKSLSGPPEKKIKNEIANAIANAYTKCEPGKYNAVLNVEGVKLYVIHELLAIVSPVFHKMFQGSWKEAKTKEVTLKGKALQAVVWMLDYTYPRTEFRLCQEKAKALLPLAVEYQISDLQKQCEEIFVGSCRPTLELLTIAERFQLTELIVKMTDCCAQYLGGSDIDEQRKAPENKDLSEELYHKLIRKRLEETDS